METYGKVVARVGVKRDRQTIWLTEAEFLKVYGTMVKPEEQVILMIDYYNLFLPANKVLDTIEDAITARALDKFPADED